MNELVIFGDVTTESALVALESDAAKYEGLYADMNNADERRYIKQQASTIGDILKRLDRARIDKAKTYKAAVEKEAEQIRLRLERANEPYTALIDEYNAERKKILDAENARKKLIEDQAAIDADYEIAVLLMDKHFADKAKAENERIAYEEALKIEATKEAAKRLIEQQEAAKQAAIDTEARRLADVELARLAEIARRDAEVEAERLEKERLAANEAHVASVNSMIKDTYIAAGFSEELAIKAVKLLVKGKIPHANFSY